MSFERASGDLASLCRFEYVAERIVWKIKHDQEMEEQHLKKQPLAGTTKVISLGEEKKRTWKEACCS